MHMFILGMGDLVVKNQPANAEEVGPVPGSGRSTGEGSGNPLQYSYLGNPMDRGAWWTIVHGCHRVRQHLATEPQTTQIAPVLH